MRKIATLFLIIWLPCSLMAQITGGQVKRPVTKKHSTNMQLSDAQKRRIIDNLLANMVYVEGGTFMMGSKRFTNAEPCHRVTLSAFYIGKYEVTQEEWIAVMGKNPSRFKGLKRPVEQISFEDCQIFINRLRNITGKDFHLPTEAQWEYAARGGQYSQGYKFAGGNILDVVAWCQDNSNMSTHNVGLKTPNELGLYDMSGNIAEWCVDYYEYYPSEPQTNPLNNNESSCYEGHVIRGGDWDSPYDFNYMVDSRSYTDQKHAANGFRLAIY